MITPLRRDPPQHSSTTAGAQARRSLIKAQFALPHGIAGALAGWVMVKAGNYSGLNQHTIELLELHGDERVLEIGCGPGEALHLLAKTALSYRLAGVDPSPVMLDRARRRNRRAIRDGRLQLCQGTAEALPWPDGSFDAVFAVNTAQLWTPLDASITELRRALAPGGRAVLALHQHCVTSDGQSTCGLDLQAPLVEGLTGTGCTVTTASQAGKGGTTLYVTAQLPNAQPSDQAANE